MLKYISRFVFIAGAVLIIYGYLATDTFFTINIHDSYYVIAYRHLGMFIILLLFLIYLINRLFKQIKSK